MVALGHHLRLRLYWNITSSITSALYMISRTVLTKRIKRKTEATYCQINLVLLFLTLKMLMSAGYRPWDFLLKSFYRREISLYSFSDASAHWYSKDQLLWDLTGKRAWFAIFWENTFLKIFEGILLLVKPAAIGLQRN